MDLIILFFLAKGIGRLAVQKGLPPGMWKLYTVLAWLAGEFIGVAIGMLIFGQDNLFSILIVALGCAFPGYLIVKNILEKKPDVFDEEVNQVSVDDLHPPRK